MGDISDEDKLSIARHHLNDAKQLHHLGRYTGSLLLADAAAELMRKTAGQGQIHQEVTGWLVSEGIVAKKEEARNLLRSPRHLVMHGTTRDGEYRFDLSGLVGWSQIVISVSLYCGICVKIADKNELTNWLDQTLEIVDANGAVHPLFED